MKKRIYDYIKEKKVVSIHDITDDLNLHPIIVLKTVEELRTKILVRMYPPIPLSIDTNTSCLYTTLLKSIRQIYHFILIIIDKISG